jgi:hypothetical protein
MVVLKAQHRKIRDAVIGWILVDVMDLDCLPRLAADATGVMMLIEDFRRGGRRDSAALSCRFPAAHRH